MRHLEGKKCFSCLCAIRFTQPPISNSTFARMKQAILRPSVFFLMRQ
jgi:hypothetical protein